MPFLSKYGVASAVDGIVLIRRGTTNFQVNPTLAAGDVVISKDGGAFANLATLPVVTPAGSTSVQISLSIAELTCKRAIVRFIDQSFPKEWNDNEFIVETYGNASAQFVFDFSSASVSQTGDTYGLLTAADSELASMPTTVSSIINKIRWLFQYFKLRRTVTNSAETMYKEDAATVLGSATVSDDGTTFDKGEMT